MALMVNDRYALRKLLGGGGMGRVFLAQDMQRQDLLVALKTLPPGDQSSEGLRCLEHEYLVLADLAHPSLVQVYDFDRVRYVVGEPREGDPDDPLDSGAPFFAREYVAGDPLQLASLELNTNSLLRLLLDLTGAVTYLHRQEVLHRDLKPDNVMVVGLGEDRAPRIKILDFGLAALNETPQGQVGTVSYLAPELMHGGDWTPAAELFSLGLIFYEVFAGRPAYAGESAAAVARAHKKGLPPPLPPHLPSSLRRITEQLMDPEPGHRPRHEDIARALQTALETPDTHRDRFWSTMGSSRLTGRDTELTLLERAITRVTCPPEREGTQLGRMVLITGQPGIGKSRLLNALRHRALVAGMRFLTGVCHPQGEAFSAARALLKPLIEARPYLVTPEREILRTILADKPLTYMDHRTADISPHQAMVRIFDAARGLLEDAAREQPLGLALEDLQWVDPESLELFVHLARHLARHPVLLVGTSWPPTNAQTPVDHLLSELADLPQETDWIELEGFETAHIRVLLRRAAGMEGASDEVIAHLESQTDGNPLFIEELLKLSDGLDGLEALLENPQTPTAVSDAFQEQLLSLTPLAQKALRGLAVWGMVAGAVDIAIVADMDRADCLTGLEEAISHQIVRELGNGYWFWHTAVAGLLEGMMSREEESAFHRRAGKRREASRQLHDPERLERLVTHFSRAGEPALALGYALTGARMAEERFLARRAVELYERARDLGLEALGQAFGGAAGLIEIRERLARLYTWTGVYDRAEEEARSLLEDPWVKWDQPTCARLWALLGDLYSRRGEQEEALQYFDRALAGSNNQISATEVLVKMAEAQLRRGQLEASRTACEQAVRRLGALDAPVLRASIAYHLGKCSQQQADFSQALEHYAEARALYTRANYQPGVAATINAAAQVHIYREQYALAVQALQDALQLQEQLGDVEGAAITLDRLALATWGMQDTPRASAYAKRCLETYRRIGSGQGEGRALATLGLLELARGIYGDAIRHFQEAIAQQRKTEDESNLIVSHQNLGLVFLEIGAIEEAEASVQTALELARKSKSRGREARCFQILGNLEALRGRCDAARTLYERAISAFETLEQKHLLADASCAMVELELKEHRLSAAWAHVRAAQEYMATTSAQSPLGIQISLIHFLVAEADPSSDPKKTFTELCELEPRVIELGIPDQLTRLWSTTGAMALRLGRPREACRYLSKAMALIKSFYDQLPPRWRPVYVNDPRRQEVRRTLEIAVEAMKRGARTRSQ